MRRVQFSVVPSPKFQDHAVISPAGVELSVNVTSSVPAVTSVLSAENDAIGADEADLVMNEVSDE